MDTINKNKQEIQLPQLIKRSATYKLFVPAKVEEKIRYLIRKFPNTEWSGILFYSHTGGFETSDLEIHCEDIYPMDLGTSGFTEFKMTGDVASYMADNIELFDCDMGLAHSHHTLGAFFSGQDTTTLQLEGNDTNCFVSLIVDTKGTYQAAITRKVQTKSEVIIKTLGTSYEFFGEGAVTAEPGTIAEKKQVIDKEVIEYFMLDVEREVVENPLGYLDDRFDVIISKKNESKKSIPTKPLPFEEDDFSWSNWREEKEDRWPEIKKEKVSQSLLFTNEEMGEWTPDPKLIKEAIIHMIVLSLSVNTENGFDLKQYIKKHMEKLYDKVFEDDEMEAMTGVGKFELWCDFITDYLVMNFNDPSSPMMLLQEDVDAYYSAVALAIIEQLQEYAGENEYIDKYIEAFERYTK